MNLEGNNLGVQNLIKILEILEKFKDLTVINLSNNKIGVE